MSRKKRNHNLPEEQRHTAYSRLRRPIDCSIFSLMPSWTLTCQNCSKSFTHSKIEESKLSNYYLPQMPLSLNTDGSVHVEFEIVNNTDVDAVASEIGHELGT